MDCDCGNFNFTCKFKRMIMKKTYLIIILLATMSCQIISAKTLSDNEKIRALEEKCATLQEQQRCYNDEMRRFVETQKGTESTLGTLARENDSLSVTIDSLRNVCKNLSERQSSDRTSINGKIEETNSNVKASQDTLQNRTIWGAVTAFVLLVIVIGVTIRLAKRIKSGDSSIEEVRKAQDALQVAQNKMQEESVKLDSQLLTIVQKQLDSSTSLASKETGKPDHSLVVKLANEIARIETNLSKMDKSVRGYKQLVQAKDRMINNVRANGYEIISLLGQEYNDGMQFQARFVPDESLPEGKRIITGMIKMQVNYNGKMIQPAEIVVSQNI